MLPTIDYIHQMISEAERLGIQPADWAVRAGYESDSHHVQFGRMRKGDIAPARLVRYYQVLADAGSELPPPAADITPLPIRLRAEQPWFREWAEAGEAFHAFAPIEYFVDMLREIRERAEKWEHVTRMPGQSPRKMPWKTSST